MYRALREKKQEHENRRLKRRLEGSEKQKDTRKKEVQEAVTRMLRPGPDVCHEHVQRSIDYKNGYSEEASQAMLEDIKNNREIREMTNEEACMYGAGDDPSPRLQFAIHQIKKAKVAEHAKLRESNKKGKQGEKS